MVGTTSPQSVSSLNFEIEVLRAKNVEIKSPGGNLFVRYYLSAGNDKRIQLNTQEISSESNLFFWNQSFSLELSGTEESINKLKQESLVFELRWRSKNSILGKIRGSQVVGRAQIPWRRVLESQKMGIEEWVTMDSKKSCAVEGLKPPAVEIAMRSRVPSTTMESKKKRNRKWNYECGCCQDIGCTCEDCDVFALVAALEAF
ncbi:hypothetical protein Tsubulata_004433 [Turnera subulata]|uniref:C2 domain-containing protein n=1 Tax=Turnera subulata TaxID=218843 RepID=A0A9Q0GE89_9ROSI|nr:hypothetical protein Tsubulata_004433 [Turnera subulata]